MLFDKFELRYLPLFHEEMKERALYIAVDLGNPKAADDLVDAVEEAIHDRLETNPEGFEPVPSERAGCYVLSDLCEELHRVLCGHRRGWTEDNGASTVCS